MNPIFGLRILSLLVSAVARLAAEDPAGFLGKVGERVRTSDNRVLSRLPAAPLTKFTPENSVARETIERGELTAGIALIAAQGDDASKSDRHLAQRTRERLEQLQVVPPVGRLTSTVRSRNHRVLHVLTNSLPYTHSGYTLRSHNVLQSIKNAGVDVHAVTRLAYPVLVGKLPKSETQIIDGISYERLLPWSYPLNLQSREDLAVEMIVERARTFGATVLHTTTDFKNAIVTSRAAEKLEIPWVYEIRGELESTWLSRRPSERQKEAAESEFFLLAREQEKRHMTAASAVVALSETSRQQLIQRGVPADTIHVVPNAVDDDEIGRKFDKKVIRRELGLDDKTVFVGTVTSVVDYEGLDVLITALTHLPHTYAVLIVGDGTSRPALEDLARQLGLTDRVHFAGRQLNASIWRWYAALDVFVVPRKDTPVCRTVTPIKPLTAMTLDIPVVASDLPALREVTGERAEYVVAEDPESLAKGIVSAIGREQGGPQWVRDRTWSSNGRRYLELYDGLSCLPKIE